MRVGVTYRFNIINCEKSNSQFNYGESHKNIRNDKTVSTIICEVVFLLINFRLATNEYWVCSHVQRSALVQCFI